MRVSARLSLRLSRPLSLRSCRLSVCCRPGRCRSSRGRPVAPVGSVVRAVARAAVRAVVAAVSSGCRSAVRAVVASAATVVGAVLRLPVVRLSRFSSGCRPGHGRATLPLTRLAGALLLVAAGLGRHGRHRAPHGRGRWCGSRRTTAQRRAARPAHPGGRRPCRPDDRPGGRPGPGARPVRTCSPARGRRLSATGPLEVVGREVVAGGDRGRRGGCGPPDWRALMAVTRSPLRILAVPLMPMLRASPWSSARRMV